MSNSIGLASAYVPMLDEVLAAGATSSAINVAPGIVRAADSAGTFYIPKTSLVGLGTYSKATGFPAGDATFAYEAHAYSYDRGREFSIDAMDDLETAGMAFGTLATQFIRTKVVPEVDAIRYAALATGAGEGTYGTLDASSEWVAAIDTAIETLGSNGANVDDNAVLFVTHAGLNYLKNSDANSRYTNPGQNPDRRFGMWDGITVVAVPAGRFYSEATLNAGATANAGGYTNGGDALNFILLDKSCAFADAKHTSVRVFDPATNQDADAWKFQYRLYHDCFVLDNSAEGIYVHSVTEIS